MHSIAALLTIGFLLGIRHAFEADHLAAVLMLVGGQKSPLKAAAIGAFWGLGHTLSVLLVGFIVLLLHISIPKQVSLAFEILAGCILIFLGIRAFFAPAGQRQKHAHTHEAHEHVYLHADDRRHVDAERGRSFLVGIIHGLAGSGGLMVLVLTSIQSVYSGICYILFFGVGSIAGMSLISFFVGLPYTSLQKFHAAQIDLHKAAGVVSVAYGVYFIYNVFSFAPFHDQ